MAFIRCDSENVYKMAALSHRAHPQLSLPLMDSPIAPVFHPCIAAQHSSADLVIYSRDVGRVVTIA